MAHSFMKRLTAVPSNLRQARPSMAEMKILGVGAIALLVTAAVVRFSMTHLLLAAIVAGVAGLVSSKVGTAQHWSRSREISFGVGLVAFAVVEGSQLGNLMLVVTVAGGVAAFCVRRFPEGAVAHVIGLHGATAGAATTEPGT